MTLYNLSQMNMMSRLKLAYFVITAWDRFFHIIVNFEKYENLENSQTKSRKGFEGVRTLLRENTKKIDLLDFEIWQNGKQKFQEFP